MRKYFNWTFAKPYIVNIILYIILVCLATIFSIGSILSASNFLSVLFQEGISNTPIVNPSVLDNLLNNVYGNIIAFGKEKALLIFGILIFIIYFLKDIFSYLAAFIISSVRSRMLRNIRNMLFKKYISLPLSYINTHRKGDLISRISNDIIEYDENVLKSIISFLSAIITVILYFLVLLYIDYKLTLVVLVVFPIVSAFISLISRSLRSSSKHLQQKNSNLVSIIEQTISGLRIIKAHTAIEMMNERFVHFNASFTRLRNGIYRKVDLASPMSEFFGNTMLIGLLLFGSSRVISYSPTLSPEIFIVYLVLFTLIIKPAKDIPTAFFNLKKGKASIERIVEILEIENKIKEPNNPIPFPNFDKGIIFNNVSFAYLDKLVLKNINIVFEKGKTTAIVGSSGSGKSTLIDLIPKFYQPTEGEILFDNINSCDILSNQIRNQISIVTQDTILFNDTVINNITFGFENYTLEQVKNAAKIANAHQFIESLPDGYNTIIGDRGSNLSGGQRQRLSIARAILKNSEILILDEATSALDTENERLVQDAISKITIGKTSIIIAHRLSTIYNADKILVLDKGEIKEVGTHKELISINGIYSKLCKMQEV
ncbi:MAG: ABC transporter ATP-binding protein [Bacteroidales bacterium]|jgi:subfamily B ATP-binding cassette protein MsbA|nr:ABC transporter ATP-binding protein [Bacteroidales bacterium]MDD4001281.1 ABC transporter ATP-binding protein [Bacteroidales bacterium]MDD4528488.1 ABC transporter ATP-binding protein [Bacteroidales bacterium]MDD4829981.1 ABC transporter ATP-binding protein [Bacteroidales bacterium]